MRDLVPVRVKKKKINNNNCNKMSLHVTHRTLGTEELQLHDEFVSLMMTLT